MLEQTNGVKHFVQFVIEIPWINVLIWTCTSVRYFGNVVRALCARTLSRMGLTHILVLGNATSSLTWRLNLQ
jgi:hypothetical protein